MSKFTTILPLISAGFKIATGVSQSRAAESEADLQEEQGRIAQQEARVSAERSAKEKRKFLARQKLAFIKNGVSLEGSPLLVLEETLTESQKEIDAIIKRGSAQQRLAGRRAEITRARGRRALLGSIGKATPDIFETAGEIKDIFKATKKPKRT